MGFIDAAEVISCYWLGQVTIKQLEKFLWLLEKCSQWSLPPPDVDKEKDLSLIRPQLTRPLPWVLFLPMLFVVRVWREMVSLTTVLCGGEPFTAIHMVKYIQNSRRTLRAVKYHGIRYRRLLQQASPEKLLDEELSALEKYKRWINKALFFSDVNDNSQNQIEGTKGEFSESTDAKVSSKKRQLSVDDNKLLDDEDDQWEDDNDVEGDDFNPDAVLKELATKVEELESDPDDPDYSESSEDDISSGDSASGEDGDCEELNEKDELINGDDYKTDEKQKLPEHSDEKSTAVNIEKEKKIRSPKINKHKNQEIDTQLDNLTREVKTNVVKIEKLDKERIIPCQPSEKGKCHDKDDRDSDVPKVPYAEVPQMSVKVQSSLPVLRTESTNNPTQKFNFGNSKNKNCLMFGMSDTQTNNTSEMKPDLISEMKCKKSVDSSEPVQENINVYEKYRTTTKDKKYRTSKKSLNKANFIKHEKMKL